MPDEFDINKLSAELINANIDRFILIGSGILKGASHTIRSLLKSTYSTYLTRAYDRYSKTKTFFIRDEPAHIYTFYVPLGIATPSRSIRNTSIAVLRKVAMRAVITGTAGTGKTTLMRHLFLNCIKDNHRVPVFIELRHLNNSDTTLKDQLHSTLELHGLELDRDYVTRAFAAGHFTVLIDGFDELEVRLRRKVADEIQALASTWVDTQFIVSSRPDEQFAGWNNFTQFETLPLNVHEAVELVEKLPFDDGVKTRFIDDLRVELFDKHESFLSNPLLLSIMLLTYGQSADIPKKLSVFYNQAYEALFQRHDAFKGAYQRPRKTALDIQDFARVFSAFCIVTYDKQAIEFTRLDASEFLRKAKEVTSITFLESDYLDDLLQAVCLLVADGLQVSFAHRSFQEYFVARFIQSARPAHQEVLIKRYTPRMGGDNVIGLLHEMDRELVEQKLIIPLLDEFSELIGVQRTVGITHYLRALKILYNKFSIDGPEPGDMYGYLASDSWNGLISFLEKRYAEDFKKAGVTLSWTESQWGSFVKKHFHDQNRTGILTGRLTTRDPFVRELAESKCYWSKSHIEALMALRREIRRTWKRTEESIDRILEL